MSPMECSVVGDRIDWQASFATIQGTVAQFDSVKDQVHASRGISMASTATRKQPNAFTFLRHIEVLKDSGCLDQSTAEPSL